MFAFRRFLSSLRPVAGILVVVGVMLSIGAHVRAASVDPGTSLNQVGMSAGISGGNDLLTIIGRVINVGLSLVGVVLLGLLLYSGYEWMTSNGDPAKVETARARIRNAIIGLVIIASAFAITTFIMSLLGGVTSDSGGGSGVGPGATSLSGLFPGRAGSLGNGIIEYHYPMRDATGIPRNTSIILSFKEPVRVSSLVQGYVDGAAAPHYLNTSVLRIFPTHHEDQAYAPTQVLTTFTSDHKKFVLRLNGLYFGSPTTTSDYTVDIKGGDGGLLREDGRPAFQGAFSSGYAWRFGVSTVLDLTPPHVISVIPMSGGSYAPNIVVQINFDKPIDPTSASGIYHAAGGGFTNLQVDAAPISTPTASHHVSGEWRIANRFLSVEFTSDASCGINSCGRQVYCLPANASVTTLIKAATLSDQPPQARVITSGSEQLFDGVVDVSGNSFDGNNDGRAEGPDVDNYAWTFGTSARPNLTPPHIASTLPPAGDAAGASHLGLDQKPQATFQADGQAGILQNSTVGSETVRLTTNEPASLADTLWRTVGVDVLDAEGHPVVSGSALADKSRVTIDHRAYVAAPAGGAWNPEYDPSFGSELNNIYQNCFNPASSARCTGGPSCCDDRADTICHYPAPSSGTPSP